MFRPRQKGLLDFLAAALAITAVYTGTPLGGIADRAVRTIFRMGPPEKPLIAWFEVASAPARERVPGAKMAEVPVTAPAEQDTHLAKVRPGQLDAHLARAFSAVASGGIITMDTAGALWYDVRDLPHHSADRQSLGLRAPQIRPEKPEVVTAASVAIPRIELGLRERLAGALDLLSAYEKRLGGEEAALAAWAVGLEGVERAVDRARLTGAPDPARFEGLRPHLIRAEADRAEGFVRAVGALRIAYGMRWPLAGSFPVTSAFGFRHHPVLGGRRHHDGVDLGAPEGTAIRAAAPGRIVYAGADGVNGLYVKLSHGHGLDTAYCHASRLAVREGETVEAGQIIAYVGSTGRSTGPHLHYGVFVDRTPVDPLVFRPPNLDMTYAPDEGAMGRP